MKHDESENINEEEKKKFEWHAFFFITLILFPVLSIIFIGGYGFAIWMSQLFLFGLPGHG